MDYWSHNRIKRQLPVAYLKEYEHETVSLLWMALTNSKNYIYFQFKPCSVRSRATRSSGLFWGQQSELYGPEHSEVVLTMSRNKITLRWGGALFGAFAELRKTTSIVVMSVRPPARNNCAPTGRIFITFYTRICRKYAEKIPISINPDKNNGKVKWSPM
jgi:hypothetical protein